MKNEMAKFIALLRGNAASLVSKVDIDDPLLTRKIPELRERDTVSNCKMPFALGVLTFRFRKWNYC